MVKDERNPARSQLIHINDRRYTVKGANTEGSRDDLKWAVRSFGGNKGKIIKSTGAK